jgi:hypothetical protein
MKSAVMLRLGVHISSLVQPVAYGKVEVTEDGFLGSTTTHDLQNVSPALKYSLSTRLWIYHCINNIHTPAIFIK